VRVLGASETDKTTDQRAARKDPKIKRPGFAPSQQLPRNPESEAFVPTRAPPATLRNPPVPAAAPPGLGLGLAWLAPRASVSRRAAMRRTSRHGACAAEDAPRADPAGGACAAPAPTTQQRRDATRVTTGGTDGQGGRRRGFGGGVVALLAASFSGFFLELRATAIRAGRSRDVHGRGARLMSVRAHVLRIRCSVRRCQRARAGRTVQCQGRPAGYNYMSRACRVATTPHRPPSPKVHTSPQLALSLIQGLNKCGVHGSDLRGPDKRT
jgi:hypothetical protein